MLNFFKKKIERLESRKTEMLTRAKECDNLEELKKINFSIDEINKEIDEIREEAEEYDKMISEKTNVEEGRSVGVNFVPENAKIVNPLKTAKFEVKNEKRNVDVRETEEYRSAFKDYVQKGIPIPAELRAGDATTSVDTGAAVPMTVMNEVINTIRKRYGNLYEKVRKMSMQGGVQVPVGALEANFKWINESTVSPRQKVGTLDKITFNYHTLEIRVAQTFLQTIVTLTAFESEVTRIIAIAYLQAMDRAIVNGSGDGQPLGILNDARVTNEVEMTASDMSNWTKWRKNFFAKLPLGYRAGEFIFPLSTVDSYLETMADSNNNPIFRQSTGLVVNDGDSIDPNGTFFGRRISLVEPDILPDFDTAEAGDVIGIYWQPEEYAVNENFGFTMRRYFDEETNEFVSKALAIVDGKILNPTGYVLIKKKAG